MRGDTFLRHFCAWGSVATGYTVYRFSRIDVPFDIPFIVVCIILGTLGGSFMALLTSWKHDELVQVVADLIDWFDRGSPRPPVNVRERITVPLPPEQALAACRAAVEQVPKATGVQLDTQTTLQARVGMTWRSNGERIRCSVRPVDGGSEVEIHSRPWLRTTLLDLGKNRENVDRIRAALEELARQDALPGVLADPRNELASSGDLSTGPHSMPLDVR